MLRIFDVASRTTPVKFVGEDVVGRIGDGIDVECGANKTCLEQFGKGALG